MRPFSSSKLSGTSNLQTILNQLQGRKPIGEKVMTTLQPRPAIAVTLQGVPVQGAAFAAPVAREVMERLLQ
jgi:hypothetical protein